MMEPFLKAVGGKRWLTRDREPSEDGAPAPNLAREIASAAPKFYVELFAGGGAVALALPSTIQKIVADTNPAFIAVWRAIRSHKPEALMAELAKVYRQYPDSAWGYAKAREELREHQHLEKAIVTTQPVPLFLEPGQPPSLRFAALVLYINVRCFNGLWRVNSAGLMNTPWGKYKKPRRLNLDELKAYRVALSSTTALCADFRLVLASLLQLPKADRSKTAIYADPPYSGTFDGYTASGFDDTDQRDLARWLQHVASLGMQVWCTNSDTPLIRELYSWARIESISEQHSVGATAARRGRRDCLLIRSTRIPLKEIG